MDIRFSKNFNRAATLWVIAALLLCSCGGNADADDIDKETLITQQSEDLVVISSENGQLSYRFETPLLERYELASEPFMEFREGVKVETYDSTGAVASELIANYAKYLELQDLWEARGDVVAKNAKGQTLETQQLFWDQKSDQIYSNVTSKVTQENDVIIGVGFVSNSKFDDFEFRRPRGQVLVETTQNDIDSTSILETEPILPADFPVTTHPVGSGSLEETNDPETSEEREISEQVESPEDPENLYTEEESVIPTEPAE